MTPALVALVLAAAPAAPPDEVILLGLRQNRGLLTTWVVDARGASCAGSGLAVPRKDGFWRLDLVERKEGGFIEAVVRTRAGAAKPRKLGPPGEPTCSGSKHENVLFVGPDHVSVERLDEGYCEGAAHPWAARTLRTFRLDDREHDLDVRAVFDPAAGPLLAQASRKARAAMRDRERAECLVEEGLPQSFGLVRREGAWIVRAALDHGNESCRGNVEYYSVDLPEVPVRLTGSPASARPWAAWAAEQPGLLDVVDTGRLAVLVRSDGFEVLAGGKRVAKVPHPGASLVMVQWAKGKAAARWRTEAKRLLDGPLAVQR
ncbi:MAG: hypothetical protein QM704_04735 [Anaeromyxobacteraceae bacterium]